MAKKSAEKKDGPKTPPAKHRDAGSGQYVTKKYADKNPKTTIKENAVKPKGTVHTGPRKKK